VKSSKIVGDNIRGFREIQGYTQAEFARHAKLHRDYIGGVERGVRNISVQSLFQIANALGVEPQMLLIEGAYRWVNKVRKDFGRND
jgi:transcriptional regulator with XRE-family HTH domain